MRSLSVLIVVLIISGCSQQNLSKCILTGRLENSPDTVWLDLVDLNSGKVFQKILAHNGKFSLSFKLKKETYFGLWPQNSKDDSQRLFFWLENSKINIDANFKYLSNARVEGSLSNDIYSKYVEIEKEYKDLKTAGVRLTDISASQNAIDSLQKLSERVLVHYRPDLFKFYLQNINSDVAFYFLYHEPIKFKSALFKSDIKNLLENLSDEKKYSKEGTFLKEFCSYPEVPKVGEKYIDISQNTPEGRPESISKNLGKYTILIFWSSGCSPSLWLSPRLKNMYKLYHDKGLNIVGISCDDDYNSWRNAIQKDTIPWINISDLKGWYNKAFLLYGIYYTPSMILLDDKGNIVDNQLSQKWIEHELEKKFK